jgi:hypothetical protein
MYYVNSLTKAGAYREACFSDYDDAVAEMLKLYQRRIESEIWDDSVIPHRLGSSWKDDSQYPRWNYSYEGQAQHD